MPWTFMLCHKLSPGRDHRDAHVSKWGNLSSDTHSGSWSTAPGISTVSLSSVLLGWRPSLCFHTHLQHFTGTSAPPELLFFPTQTGAECSEHSMALAEPWLVLLAVGDLFLVPSVMPHLLPGFPCSASGLHCQLSRSCCLQQQSHQLLLPFPPDSP